mgnify:CR=1 FL=1
MQKKILFVNGSSKTQNLQYILDNMKEIWDMRFVESEADIWKSLANGNYDALVYDIHTPGINAIEVLQEISVRYPQMIRVIIVGPSDQGLVLEMIRSNHQTITHPFNSLSLKGLIDRSCKLRELLHNKELKRFVAGISHLPSLPSLYQQIVAEIQSPSVSIKRVADLISQDVTMTAKILQLVNSAFFGLPHKIVSPQQAAILLGINILKGLVLHVHIFSSFELDPRIEKFSIRRLARHSLLVCKLAREIVLTETNNKSMEENAFIAGLLHDIGKLILIQDPERYNQVLAHCQARDCNRYQAEYEILGASHAEVGAYLLDLWGIPEPVVQAIAFHHNPIKSMEPNFSVLTVVHVADALVSSNNSGKGHAGLDLFYLLSIRKKDDASKWVEIWDCIKSQTNL